MAVSVIRCALLTAVLTGSSGRYCPTARERIVLPATGWGKDSDLKSAVELLLNVYCFATIMKLENSKSNHGYSGTMRLFSHSGGCLLPFLMVYFDMHKFLNFYEAQFIYFSFGNSCLGVMLRNCCLI